MTEYRVSCIHKPDRNSRHEHITHIGGIHNGSRWKLTREQAIQHIDGSTAAFYVISPTGKKAVVGVVRPNGGHPYLRTYSDGYWNDNLLSLAECPLR